MDMDQAIKEAVKQCQLMALWDSLSFQKGFKEMPMTLIDNIVFPSSIYKDSLDHDVGCVGGDDDSIIKWIAKQWKIFAGEGYRGLLRWTFGCLNERGHLNHSLKVFLMKSHG